MVLSETVVYQFIMVCRIGCDHNLGVKNYTGKTLNSVGGRKSMYQIQATVAMD